MMGCRATFIGFRPMSLAIAKGIAIALADRVLRNIDSGSPIPRDNKSNALALFAKLEGFQHFNFLLRALSSFSVTCDGVFQETEGIVECLVWKSLVKRAWFRTIDLEKSVAGDH